MNLVQTRFAPPPALRLLTMWAVLLWLHGLAPAAAAAQMRNDHVSWTLLTPEIKGKPGEIVYIKIKANIVAGAHVYSTATYPDSVPGPSPTGITVGEADLVSMAGEVKGSKAPKRVYDPNFDIETEYWEGAVTLTIPVRIAKKAKPGKKEGRVSINFMTCTDKLCRPPTDETFTFALRVQKR